MTILTDVIHLSKIQGHSYPIQGKLAYATPHNFVGRVLNGYHPEALDIFLLTPKAARAICEVQNYLINTYELGLFIFDAYRPRRTVFDFLEWSQLPPANTFELERKALHYPHIEKNQLFSLGYISNDSNHCYGNTVDLALINIKNNTLLNMGTIFDFMDRLSHLDATVAQIGAEAYQNRQILLEAMMKFGFEPYEKEFWHFCHEGRKGSEVKVPFDIPIMPNLKYSK